VSAINVGAKAVDVTDTRAGLLTTEKIVDEASVDRYGFIKNSYQQRRESLVHDGNMAEEDEVQLEDIDEPSSASPAKKPVISNQNVNTQNNTKAPVTDNSGLPPVIDNSRHMLDLSAPDK
ncbi:MAG: MlaA family lipoprotein, partial [Methylococcaceae bacterium]|nr:MlaA family lipoprotein [Methylococcaceae bacterium]